MSNTNLQELLRDSGYDLIDGPIRNQKILQLWIKDGNNQPELYYEHIKHAFQSDAKLPVVKDKSLSITDEHKNEYAFNIGITMVQNILRSLGIGSVDFSSAFDSGKKVSISYKNAHSEIVPVGNISDFLSTADFIHPNTVLLKNANRNHIMVITGLVMAEKLVADFELDKKADAKTLNALKKAAGPKIDFQATKKNSLTMNAGDRQFPIAIKANIIDFDRGRFNGLSLLTDGRNLF